MSTQQPAIDQSQFCFVCGGPSHELTYICETCQQRSMGTMQIGMWSKDRTKSSKTEVKLVAVNDYNDENIIDVFGYDSENEIEIMIRLTTPIRLTNEDITK